MIIERNIIEGLHNAVSVQKSFDHLRSKGGYIKLCHWIITFGYTHRWAIEPVDYRLGDLIKPAQCSVDRPVGL